MDKWLKDILPDKDPYHKLSREGPNEEKGGSGIRVPVLQHSCVFFFLHFIIQQIKLTGKEMSSD